MCTNRLEYGYESTEYWVRMNQHVSTNLLGMNQLGYETTGYPTTLLQYYTHVNLLRSSISLFLYTVSALPWVSVQYAVTMSPRNLDGYKRTVV